MNDSVDKATAWDAISEKNAEIARLRAGFMKCLQAENQCDAWLHESACRAAEGCGCAHELELWINRAALKAGT